MFAPWLPSASHSEYPGFAEHNSVECPIDMWQAPTTIVRYVPVSSDSCTEGKRCLGRPGLARGRTPWGVVLPRAALLRAEGGG